VIAKFDDTEISVDEFRRAFLKNEDEKKTSQRDSSAIADFLKLYVNYRMKLADAKERGYDSSPETLQEKLFLCRIGRAGSLHPGGVRLWRCTHSIRPQTNPYRGDRIGPGSLRQHDGKRAAAAKTTRPAETG
jgi:hypothetical protein